jgi:hypothetical protein
MAFCAACSVWRIASKSNSPAATFRRPGKSPRISSSPGRFQPTKPYSAPAPAQEIGFTSPARWEAQQLFSSSFTPEKRSSRQNRMPTSIPCPGLKPGPGCARKAWPQR